MENENVKCEMPVSDLKSAIQLLIKLREERDGLISELFNITNHLKEPEIMDDEGKLNDGKRMDGLLNDLNYEVFNIQMDNNRLTGVLRILKSQIG